VIAAGGEDDALRVRETMTNAAYLLHVQMLFGDHADDALETNRATHSENASSRAIALFYDALALANPAGREDPGDDFGPRL
jgi:hypothetical protein